MKNKKGIILIFVLMILVTFSLLGLGLSFRARIENRLSQYFAAEAEDFYLAKAKLNQVMVKIAQDDNDYDNFREEWARGLSVELEGDGCLKMTIEDEDGKLDINTASSQWLDDLLFFSQYLKEQIVKNRPFLVEEEIFYLPGFDEDLFLGGGKSGILNLVTTQNHDKININTAREQVFYSIPGLSRTIVDTILSLRRNEAIDNIETLKEVAGITVNEYQILKRVLKTTSDFYTVRIQIDDKRDKIKKSFRITLQKDLDTKTVKIVRWLEQ